MSNSVRPHRQQPTRLPRPWDSPGKNTGVGCHFLLQCMKVKSESEVSQSCSTLSDPMDYSLPGSSIHGIFQARVLEWGAIAFSRWMDRYIIKVSMKKLIFTFDNHLQNGRKIRKLDEIPQNWCSSKLWTLTFKAPQTEGHIKSSFYVSYEDHVLLPYLKSGS